MFQNRGFIHVMTVFEEIESGRMTRKQAKDFLKKESAKFTNKFVVVANESPNPCFVRAYRNKKFLVQIFNERKSMRLSINKTELNIEGTAWKDGITWDEIQNIKNQLGFKDFCGLEVYPPENDLVNVANIRHIFIVEKPPLFMWRDK